MNAVTEGRLSIRIRWDGTRIVGVIIDSTRPVDAPRVLVGRTVDEALSLVPRLFSLCGRAQAAAAARALAAAQGAAAAGEDGDAREVAVESLLESTWRLLHDLPGALGAPPQIGRFAELRRALVASLGASPRTAFDEALARFEPFLVEMVLGSSGPGDGVDAYADWCAAGATPVAGWLHELDTRGLDRRDGEATPLMPAHPDATALRALAARLAEDGEFARRPVWNGRPVETGALAQHQETSLLRQMRADRGAGCTTRLAARLVDVRLLSDGLAGRAPLVTGGGLAIGERAGLGWAQTARGMLVHRAELGVDGRIADYRILAPTEWNFHPSGALARGLEARPAHDMDELRRCVELEVLALDPCVAYGVDVEPVRGWT